MNKHIELPIAGNLWGWDTTSFTGTQVQFGSDAGNTTVGCVFMAPESATITDIGMSFAIPTGSSARTFRLELRNVNSDGTPGSTVYANTATYSYTNMGSAPFYLASTANPAVSIVPLLSSYAVTGGTLYAVCVTTIAGTWNSSNYLNLILSYDTAPKSWIHSNLPYYVSNGGTKSKNPNFLMCSSTKFYGNISPQRTDISVFGSAAYGNFFTMPATFGTYARLCGVKINFGIPAGPYNTGNFQIKVYSGNGATLYVDNTFNFGTTNTNSPNNLTSIYYFDTAVNLNPGSQYFIGIACLDDSLTLYANRYDSYLENESKIRDMYTGGLIPMQSGLINGSTPALNNQSIYAINPLIDYIDPAASGGGTSTTAGFNQGLFN